MLQVLEAVAESSTVAPGTEARGFPWKMQQFLEKERDIYIIYNILYIYIYMEFLGVWLGSDHGRVPITMPWTKNKEPTYF